jgi:predicted RNA binding protein YcfA (HicA-like mRNA interferase family)
MPRLRSLSGRDVVRILGGFGFDVVAIRGSHAKLRRTLSEGASETLTVPLHDTLAPGTIRAIYRQASRFIAERDLRAHFYPES